MPRLGVRLPYAQPQGQLSVQLRVGKKQISALVQTVHDRLIRRVASLVPEANQVQWRRSRQFEPLVVPYPLGKLLGQPYMFADVILQSLDPIMPNHKP